MWFRKKKPTFWSSTLFLFSIALFIKIILLALFSSNYQNQLFMQFVKHFLANFDNPWNYFYAAKSAAEFPYHPFMLYLLSIFYLPIYLFNIQSVIIQNFLFKMPLLLADLAITLTLLKIFPYRKKSILFFYILSPIIIYSSYMHSQLDLIPTSLLFVSIYFLQKNKFSISALIFGLALSTKLHIILALPLVLIYLFRKKSLQHALAFAGISGLLYSIFTVPYLFTPGFYHLAIAGAKQKSIFLSYASIGDLKLYLPVFAALIAYGRFSIYPKINNDLLNAFLALTFSIFVTLIPPAPAWYVWFFPFLSIIFITTYHKNRSILFFYLLLQAAYLLFFIVFYIPELHDLIFIRIPISLKIYHPILRNIAFSILEATLFLIIYTCYKFGIRSNTIYKKAGPLIIGIGGDSGSGKTTFLSDLRGLLGAKLTELEGDGDHKWERHNQNWQQFTHLNPKANWLHRQAENLIRLKEKKPIWRVEYDHDTGQFTSPRKVLPSDFIALSGLHTFYLPKMRKITDLKIYLDPSPEIRCHWKLTRDMTHRGYSKEKVLEQIKKREKDSQKYIDPQKNFADLLIQYFTDKPIDIKTITETQPIKLKTTLHSNFKIDVLINNLTALHIPFEWDYSDNLEQQHLILPAPIPPQTLLSIAKEAIPNLEELIATSIKWSPDYRGTIQLLTLFILSEKMKEQT